MQVFLLLFFLETLYIYMCVYICIYMCIYICRVAFVDGVCVGILTLFVLGFGR